MAVWKRARGASHWKLVEPLRTGTDIIRRSGARWNSSNPFGCQRGWCPLGRGHAPALAGHGEGFDVDLPLSQRVQGVGEPAAVRRDHAEPLVRGSVDELLVLARVEVQQLQGLVPPVSGGEAAVHHQLAVPIAGAGGRAGQQPLGWRAASQAGEPQAPARRRRVRGSRACRRRRTRCSRRCRRPTSPAVPCRPRRRRARCCVPRPGPGTR